MSWVLHESDCLDAMRAMPAASVDCVVTDPPYHLTSGKKGGAGGGFMGQAWDGGGIAFDPATWAAVLRVLKPGGHLLAFGGSRTFHRIAVGIEDAGFDLRDTIMWIFGSGFPKSLDVSKAIDKAAGAEREVVGTRTRPDGTSRNYDEWSGKEGTAVFGDYAAFGTITAPATDAARQWDGWGTSLKPAFEPIIVARKSLVGTVAQNVLAFGVGGLNIDGCRVEHDETGVWGDTQHPERHTSSLGYMGGEVGKVSRKHPSGRWPANVVIDDSEEVAEAFAAFGEKGGSPKSSVMPGIGVLKYAGQNSRPHHADKGGTRVRVGYEGEGTAARFFYCAKASKADRGAGNDHPTVKPQSLMRWLVRLVTPPGGLVLDPFMGSGSTGVAALAEGRRFVGVERDAGYCSIARDRLSNAEQRTTAAPAASLFA